MNKDQIEEFILLLQKYELSIAKLYEQFVANFPLYRDTWMIYANEERLHAKWINELHILLNKEKISFEQTKFTIQSTTTAINYIENQINNIAKTKIDLQQAIVVAIGIEKSLLESAFLKVFKLNGPKAQKIQARLIEATNAHLKRLIEWQTNIKKA